MSEQHIGRRIARAMITIFVFQIFWKFGGFIVGTLAFREFATRGSKDVLDAYSFAEGTIIWALYVVFDKFVFPVFLPLFSDERELRGEEESWKFANTFVNLFAPALLVTVAACMYWTPEVVDFIAPRWMDKHPATADRAIQFTRWLLPGLFFVALASFTHALLNSYKRFAHAAAGAAIHRFLQAAVFVVALKVFGAPAIWAALAFTLAAPAKLATHLIGLREKRTGYRMQIPYGGPILKAALRWSAEAAVAITVVLVLRRAGALGSWTPKPVPLALLTALLFFSARGLFAWLRVRRVMEKTLLQKVFLLAYPVLMGVVIARARDLVQDSYATHFEEGGLFGAIKYAKKVGDAPMAIIPLALSYAMFPYLCDMFTKQNLKALSETVAHAIKMIALFFVPLSVIVFVLRVPVIELLASKKVEAGLVDATALALALYALGFVFYATEMVLMQSFFSLQNTWLPTLVGAVASFGQIGMLYVAFDVLEGSDSAAKAWLGGVGVTPFVAVALAYPLSRAFKNIILGAALHHRLKLFRVRDGMSFVPQVALISAVTGVATRAAWLSVCGIGTTFLGKIVRLGVPSAVAAVAFLGALFALKRIGWPVAEFDIILKWLHETGWQKIKGKLKGKNK